MLKNLQLDHYQKKFINHNQIFKKKKQHSKNKILVEFNGWQPFHLTNSYLLNVLKEKNNAEIIAYENYSLLLPKKQSILNKAKWHIGSKFKIKTFKIYDSFGASKFIKPDFSKEIKNKTFYTFNNNILKIKSLRDLENFKCNSILIGDLLYDSYLKKYLEPTIDLTSLKFKKFSIEFLKLFYFWENYFKKNKITAVSASHGVYSFAIPLRISLSRKIDSFVPVEDKIYNFKHFSKFKNFSPTSVFMENLFFKKIFNRFSSKNKKKYIKIGKKIILNNKKNNFNYPYVRKKINRKKIKILSKKPGILILSHSFFDSPHVYGNNLFPDFKHWFNFLSKLINKTENKYSWYIKPHPNKFDLSNKEIKNFLKKNKKVNLIKTNYNFKEYQKLKIKVILTVFGQISKESVLHKILCINASKCTPSSAYSFALTPKSLTEYENQIINYKKFLKKVFNKKSLEELFMYSFMENVYFHRNYLFEDYQKYIFSKKNKQQIYNSSFYGDWIKLFNIKKHNKIINRLKNFVASKDYSISLKHN